MWRRAPLFLAFLTLLACGGGSSPQGSLPPAPPPTALDAATKADLQSLARPFATPVAGSGLEDLGFLSPWVEGVRLVGLGEATHGSREFFQMKHRLLEYFVTREGFRLFVIEASFERGLQMLEYVQGERNDLASVVHANGFWTWDTQEVAALLAWVRTWNDTHPRDQWVWCAGNDIQVLDGIPARILAQARKVDPALALALEGRLKGFQPYLAYRGGEAYQKLPESTQAELRKDLAAVQSLLGTRSADLKAALGSPQAAILARLADVLLQAEGDFRSRLGERDPAMALNTEWWMGQRGPGTRAVLWAHNFHVSLSPGLQGGEHRKSLGSAYFPMGFAFLEGGFRAYTGSQIVPCQAPPMEAPALEWGLDQMGMPRAIVPLRALGSTPGALWLNQSRPMRQLGSTWFGSNAPHTMTLQPAAHWDALIYFRTVEAARPL